MAAWLQFWTLSLYILFLSYPTVSATILRHYICKEIDFGTSGSETYLFTDLRVACWTNIWTFFAVISFFLVLVYPIGIPFFFWKQLYANRNRLHRPDVKARLGFLYAGYQYDYWYFELVDMAHKLLLSAGLAFLPVEIQLPGGMVVACLYMMILLYCKPYARQSDDSLHQLVQCELIIFLMVGWTIYNMPSAELSDRDDAAMGVLLIGVCALLIATFLFLSWHVLRLIYRDLMEVRAEQKRVEEIEEMEMRSLHASRANTQGNKTIQSENGPDRSKVESVSNARRASLNKSRSTVAPLRGATQSVMNPIQLSKRSGD
jgi:hypothetical protein